ncbi:MAG: RluA family pseudouridine synthase, partial [Actinomycetes bacterium]
ALRVHAGSRLTITEGLIVQQLEPEADVAFDVITEDEHFVVINKPAGLVVHPGAGHGSGTLVSGLLWRYPEIAKLAGSAAGEADRPGIIHRLDRGTSGLLVVARTALGASSLSAQIAQRSVERRYWGMVEGLVSDNRGVVDAPIGRSTRFPTRMVVTRAGKVARTHYEVDDRREKSARSIMGFSLETGRTHQIRVHMAAIGHPIVNDDRYGTASTDVLVENRYALHAIQLAFDHPESGERVLVKASLPDDLAALEEAATA